MKIYTASKKRLADMWVEYRDQGHNIISTWMDEVISMRSVNTRSLRYLRNLSTSCIKEAAEADVTVLYCERGENHKGSLLEIGSALGAGGEIRVVGRCKSMRHIFHYHPNWREFSTIEAALTAPLMRQKPINDFADRMQYKWDKNIDKFCRVMNPDGKGRRFEHCDARWLLKRIREETAELEEALESGIVEDILNECGDVGNFAKFIFENVKNQSEGE